MATYFSLFVIGKGIMKLTYVKDLIVMYTEMEENHV